MKRPSTGSFGTRASGIAVAFLLSLGAWAAAPATATASAQAAPQAATAQGQPAPEGFEPVTELPTQEQLPAAPLVMVAYAFVWVMLVIYVWTLWRRLGRVEKELADVARRVGEGRRS